MKLKIYECKICGKIYKRFNDFPKHIKSHNIDYENYFDTYIEPNINHKCPFCDNKCIFYKGNYRKTCGSEECRIKAINKTTKEKYNVNNNFLVKNSNNIEKRIITCRKKYNVDYALQSNEVIEKSKNTCKLKYGKEYGLSSNIFREKYIIPALIKKYNVDNVWKSKEIQNKCYQSNIKNHNGLYHTQTSEWQSKYNHGCNRKYIYNNIIFKSYYEVMFAKELDKYDISYQYETETFIYYDKFNKKHTYTPDFLVNGKIYEIKGDIFLDKDNHLINFYNRKLDYIQEAKEICMNKNKVIIIKTSELYNMIKNNTLLKFLEINN